ncbi:MAG: twin-arginine translocation signal domain-containing protein, partial [Chloroflexi bacterium]
MNTEKRISRRQALKTLAAITGAVSLASLPNWEKPVIEVGALPAHAQTSTLTISNFTGEIPNINNCEASSGIG